MYMVVMYSYRHSTIPYRYQTSMYSLKYWQLNMVLVHFYMLYSPESPLPMPNNLYTVILK